MFSESSGLLEKQDPAVGRSTDDGPQKPDQPERAVGELDLAVPRRSCSPVAVLRGQVGPAGGINFDAERLEFRHSSSQRFLEPAQPGRSPRLRAHAVHLSDEVAPERISTCNPRARWVADHLWYEVEVAHLREVVRDRAERLICGDLLEVRLRQPFGVSSIRFIGSIKELLTVAFDALSVHDGAILAGAFALDGQVVSP